MEDDKIIKLYLKRIETAISETATKYGIFCFDISNNILKNRQDAEESVNDTYLQAWNSIPPTIPNNLKAYLGKIVRNISLNRFKSKKAKKRYNGEITLVYEELSNIIPSQKMDDILDEIHLCNSINNWLETLSKEQRMVFVGRYWYFESISSISSKMNISISKTKMILMRLRNKLKEYLKNEGIQL